MTTSRTRDQLRRGLVEQQAQIENLAQEKRFLKQLLVLAVNAAGDDWTIRVVPVEVLQEAIDLAEEGWAYASDYFREKWSYQARIDALRSLLPSEQTGEGQKG